MTYRPEIDGLRALAVLPVILCHAGFYLFNGGFVGVDVFFVISGYLITRLILADMQLGRFSLLDFYERRARRILPALFIVLGASACMAWIVLTPGPMEAFASSLVAVPLFASNVLFWQETGYFDAAAELKPLLHTWSLAVEEQYYLLFPLLMLMAFRGGRRRIALVLSGGAVVSFVLAAWGERYQPEAAYYLVFSRAWELLVGALAALYLQNRSRAGWRWPWINEGVGLVGLGLIGYAVFSFGPQTSFPGWHALVPVAGTVLIVLACTRDTLLGKVLAHRVLVGIGLISYSAYLWHQPLLAFARHWKMPPLGFEQRIGLCLLALILGLLSWRFVERPFRRDHVIGSRAFVRLAIGVGVAFVLLGLAGRLTGGFPGRYEADELYLATVTKAAATEYVTARFASHHSRPFDDALPKRKILFVGDSFAEDVLNAIQETGLDEHLQISTYTLRHYCGNLYLKSDRQRHLAQVSDNRCTGRGWTDDAQLRQMALQADEIWLASAWQSWQARLVPETMANIRSDFGKEPLVFGGKHFGKVSIPHLLRMTKDERLRLSATPDADHKWTNAYMVNALGGRMIDVSAIMCGNSGSCPLFLPDGHLISFDGAHLTQHGARYLGQRLKAVGAISASVRPPARP